MKLPILIIEDDKFMLELTSSSLDEKYEVFKASSVNEAQKVLKNHIIRLVLSDINLDNENTLDFIEKLRSNELYADIPIVVYSGNCSQLDKASLLRKGIAGFIEKPISLDELGIRINHYIDHFSKVRFMEKNASYKTDKMKDLTLSQKVTILLKNFKSSLLTLR